VASLVFEDCTGYDKLAVDASPPTASTPPTSPAACLALRPRRASDRGGYRAAAGAAPGGGCGKQRCGSGGAVQAIADPLSRLVASGVLLRAGRANPQILADAVETASAQGWRRPLLAWLGVQAMRAEQAGDTAEAQRIKRRIALAGG
jgi:hypothetical protein